MSDEWNDYDYLDDVKDYYAYEAARYDCKPNSAASETVRIQAGLIGVNHHIVIQGRPCKVVEVSTSEGGDAECHFVAIDIFTRKKLEDTIPFSHFCDAPHVIRTDYQLIDISEDGFMILITEDGNTEEVIKLPTDEDLLTKIKGGLARENLLIVSVMSTMGENQIYALKNIKIFTSEEEQIYALKDIDGAN